MQLEMILGDDDDARAKAWTACTSAPDHERSAFAGKLAAVAREAAAAIAQAEAAAQDTRARSTELERLCITLSLLRVEAAKNCLLRIADEGTAAVKRTLTLALRETTTAEGKSVLVHLLSDDDARGDAILAIGEKPWPEVLPLLIEVAEADEQSARLAAKGIAKCGATAGPDETNAAADFLLEQLDDEALQSVTAVALLRFGTTFPGVAEKAKRLAKLPGSWKAVGLCLIAGVDEGNAGLLELALSGAKADEDACRRFLAPLLADADERIRSAAERTRKALDLR